MSNNFEPKEHQNLPPAGMPHLNLKREKEEYRTKGKKQKKSYNDSKRNHIKFFKEQQPKIKNLENILKENSVKYEKYFEPKYIFKIKTNPKRLIREEKFREDLKEVGIDIVSAAGRDKGVWIGHSDNADFSNLVRKIQRREFEEYPNLVDSFEEISQISVGEKIGASLNNRPYQNDQEILALDVELQPIDNESAPVFNQYLNGFRNFITDEGGNLTSDVINDNFTLLRIKANKPLFDKIVAIDRVITVNRAPIPEIRTKKVHPTKKLPPISAPDDNAHEILVLDSGIVKHPALEPAINKIFAISSKHTSHIQEDMAEDDTGHGTIVSSIALYGNISECIENSQFIPEVKISSGKIMYSDKNNEPVYDEDELLEHQFEDAVKFVTKDNPKCKIINLSIGNTEKSLYNATRQFNLAAMVDILSFKYDKIIFVISAGNNYRLLYESEHASQLLKDNEDVRIIDPASAAHALTVGSLRNYDNEINLNRNVQYPSLDTRIGPGLKNMIKPELVEFGGDKKHDILGCDYQWIPNARYFKTDAGTSVSAPIISHYLARLFNKFPKYSRNLIKALLLSSALIPIEKPNPIPELNHKTSEKDLRKILNIYGYGKPNFDSAIYSDDDRVVLKYEGKIPLNRVHYFTLNFPPDFFKTTGTKEISITLVFDPPTNLRQSSYLGCAMDFHLFKNQDVEYVKNNYSAPDETNISEIPDKLKKSRITTFKPGTRIRSHGVHIKATATFPGKPLIDLNKPLLLAVVCQDRWIKSENYDQPYAVVVTIKHTQYTGLYNQIRTRNEIQVESRVEEEIKTRVEIRG